jgi:F420-dependent oxidoreductase-like protein
MRIGLSGGGVGIDRMVQQAVDAEAEGFSALWYPGSAGGDPLVAMALAGRATERIELGTSVLQTYPCHPALQASRTMAAAAGMGRPGFVLGVGPSHQPVIEGVYGQRYDHPGRHTEEYVTILTALLHGEAVNFDGEDLHLHAGAAAVKPDPPVPVLVAALAPRLLRVAGSLADGTVLWMANAKAIESHVAPRIRAAAAAAGKPEPRIVAGLPVAVHDDEAEARRVAGEQFTIYGGLPNYRRILDAGGAAGPADAALAGDEASVAAQIERLFSAGATDVWAAPFPVGTDRQASRQRTRALLRELATS